MTVDELIGLLKKMDGSSEVRIHGVLESRRLFDSCENEIEEIGVQTTDVSMVSEEDDHTVGIECIFEEDESVEIVYGDGCIGEDAEGLSAMELYGIDEEYFNSSDARSMGIGRARNIDSCYGDDDEQDDEY